MNGMTRRQLFQSMTAAPAVLRAARPAGDKPNLLFLWTDQQRADTLACYGNTRFRVPSLNRLARECVVFDRACVTQPVCTPSRSSVLTGFWPHQNGCVHNNIPLRADVKTVPELLNDSAYRTAYMGKWHLGDEIFPQRGFEQWRAIEDGIYQGYYSAGRDKNARSHYHQFLISLGYKPDDPKHSNSFTRDFATKLPVEHTKPSFLAQEAVKFILENRREPWMLYVNTLEPHTPFASVLNDLHTPEECPLPANYPGIPNEGEPEWYKQRRKQFVSERSEGADTRTGAGFQRLQRNYAGLCSLVDQAMGRILWALETSGQWENTIIVYTSDHGEMMGCHSLLTKGVMYEEAIRVPYLMHAPFRKQKPMRITQPVSHIDTVPALMELLGRKEAAEFPGKSLVAAMEGRRAPDDVFLQWNQEGRAGGPNARTIITPDGWKMVLHDSDVSMLFNRQKDPLEMHNVFHSKEHEPIVRKLRAKIHDWQKRTGDKLAI